jgi:hypothetical protein
MAWVKSKRSRSSVVAPKLMQPDRLTPAATTPHSRNAQDQRLRARTSLMIVLLGAEPGRIP